MSSLLIGTTDSEHPGIEKLIRKRPQLLPSIADHERSMTVMTIPFSPFMPSKECPEDPAIDILSARIRAKLYGAKVILYRTFLLKILEQSKIGAHESDESMGATDVSRIDAEAARLSENDPNVLQYAEEAIKALIGSTTAFHGLGDPGSKRLIVTNIWGTAHAYVSDIAFTYTIVLTKTQSMGQYACAPSRFSGSPNKASY